MDVNLDILPHNTKDAISYGAMIAIVGAIKEASRNKFIYFTGGDGKFLSRFFKNRLAVDDTLIFKGMMKLIREREFVC
jgi:type III pantothenate kinase